MPWLLVIAISILLGGCGEVAGSASDILHPNDESLRCLNCGDQPPAR